MSQACYLDGCDRRAKCRGLCTGHYERWRRSGDNFDRSPLIEWGAAERFVAGLVAGPWPDHCVFWPFAKMTNGYGTIGVHGATRIAHRHICELAHGSPPSQSHHAAHDCGNGHLGCVSPKCLSWKTAAENAADRNRHGTDNRGQKHYSTILTPADICNIRSAYSLGNTTYFQLGERYGVGHAAIGAIVRRETWKHVA